MLNGIAIAVVFLSSVITGDEYHEKVNFPDFFKSSVSVVGNRFDITQAFEDKTIILKKNDSLVRKFEKACLEAGVSILPADNGADNKSLPAFGLLKNSPMACGNKTVLVFRGAKADKQVPSMLTLHFEAITAGDELFGTWDPNLKLIGGTQGFELKSHNPSDQKKSEFGERRIPLTVKIYGGNPKVRTLYGVLLELQSQTKTGNGLVSERYFFETIPLR
jgi:hypothetical protein